MARIETFVFFDLETTDLLTNTNVPGITELGILAIKRSHFLNSRPGEELRVQYKLLMCFDPDQKMNVESVKLSGLTNKLLKQEAELNEDAFNTINSFINCLQKPVCLIAHNGFRFHFPILKHYFQKMGVQLPVDVKCTDSLYAFYDLLNAEQMGNEDEEEYEYPASDQTTLKEQSYFELSRNRFYSGKAPADSYKLMNIYQREVEDAYLETNRAENQCIMMLKIAQGRAERFGQWVDKNHCALSKVPSIVLEDQDWPDIRPPKFTKKIL